MVRVVCSLVLILFVALSGLLKAEEQGASAPKTPDLSKFPKIHGKVVQSLGSLNSYLPPAVGAEIEWDLKTIQQWDKLTFKPLADDAVNEYYIPLAIDIRPDDASSRVVPLTVETLKTYGNGAFDNMRLMSRSSREDSPHVKVDVTSLPGRGDPNFVQIWVMVESDVLHGIVLIEGQSDAPVPNTKVQEESGQTKIGGKDPMELAIGYLRARKTDLSKHDVEKATASRYCPPESTVSQWCVHIPARAETKVDGLWIALPENGAPWRLDPKTLGKLE
jgi:hypothetical protein